MMGVSAPAILDIVQESKEGRSLEETNVVVEQRTGWWPPGRSCLIAALLLVLLSLCLCCTLSQCYVAKLPPGPGSKPAKSIAGDACPAGAVQVPVSVPDGELSTHQAVLISAPGAADRAGRELEIFLYDDPFEPDWNLIVESTAIATELCWLSPTGWKRVLPNDDILEPGTNLHNVEFLIPAGALRGDARIAVTTAD